MIREILKMGDERLLRIAPLVPDSMIGSAELDALIADMFETMEANPVITPLSQDMEEGWEGCLSVPGLRGAVSRYSLIRYEGVDPQGVRIERTAEGFHARVVQHECDHLIGRLYPSRITDFSKFGYTEVLFPGQDMTGDE
jgi:peptide deformylase